MGNQYLYTITFSFVIENQVSDSLSTFFGIRQTSSEIDENGHRVYQVNGKNILIRGIQVHIVIERKVLVGLPNCISEPHLKDNLQNFYMLEIWD